MGGGKAEPLRVRSKQWEWVYPVHPVCIAVWACCKQGCTDWLMFVKRSQRINRIPDALTRNHMVSGRRELRVEKRRAEEMRSGGPKVRGGGGGGARHISDPQPLLEEQGNLSEL